MSARPGHDMHLEPPPAVPVSNGPVLAFCAIVLVAGLSLVGAFVAGVYLKSRNDAAHVVQMKRQAEAQERIAAALEAARR